MHHADVTTGFLRPAILAAVLVCAWAGAGSASCGDYLHVLPPAGDPQPCSCQHGECHSPVPLPESTEPTTTELPRSADALLVPAAELPIPAARGWPIDSSLRPHRTSYGVFHPPRG